MAPLNFKQMRTLNTYAKYIPYVYFLAVIIYWFGNMNSRSGISAYPILLLSIPFIWQILKPNKQLNFSLGIVFVCLSSYLIMAYLSDVFDIVDLSASTQQFLIYGGLFVVANFVMALWMVKNSLNKRF